MNSVILPEVIKLDVSFEEIACLFEEFKYGIHLLLLAATACLFCKAVGFDK